MFQKIVFFQSLKLILQFYHSNRKKIIDLIIKNPNNLEMVTRILFSNRRKMINKNFVKIIWP